MNPVEQVLRGPKTREAEALLLRHNLLTLTSFIRGYHRQCDPLSEFK